MLEFKDYKSVLEIRFDIENELNEHIENIWFVYSKNTIISKSIKPISITYEMNKNIYEMNIEEINDLLGFIPCINVDITKARDKAKPYGVIYIDSKTYVNKYRASHSDSNKEANDIFDEFMSGGSSAPVDISEHSKGDTFITNNKLFCDQVINTLKIGDHKNIVYLKNDVDLGSIGYFIIYNGTLAFPKEENLAILTICEKCGHEYVRNYFKEYDSVCRECKSK